MNEASIILCRYGELFLKLGNRPRFEQQLLANVRAAVSGLPGVEVTAPHGRLFVHAPAGTLEEACSRVGRVFGLVSFSPARQVALDLETMAAAAVQEASAALERDPALRRSFRIEARRSDKQFPLTSLQLGVRLGADVQKATGVPVDLENPALVVGVEVGRESAHIFVETRPAPGGLPVGSSGRALLLLSGGIDSPVAGWLAAKRGLTMEAVYFHSPPFVGEKSRDKVVQLARVLGRWNAVRELHVVRFTDAQKRLREAGPAELAVVLYRRMMMRTADLIADRVRANALVTGESLGQVASQTLINMSAIETASRKLVLRPLVTYDKQETIALARRIGTYDLSILPYEDCCALFVPPHPSTGARPADLERAEGHIDVSAEAATLAAEAETVPITG